MSNVRVQVRTLMDIQELDALGIMTGPTKGVTNGVANTWKLRSLDPHQQGLRHLERLSEPRQKSSWSWKRPIDGNRDVREGEVCRRAHERPSNTKSRYRAGTSHA